MDPRVGAQDAISTLRSMGMAGVVPSTDTFNTLMSACLSREDPGAVPRLFRRLISLGHSPDALSYTSLITSLTRLGRPEDAVSPRPCPFQCYHYCYYNAHMQYNRQHSLSIAMTHL